jgi:tetratricopeptide (TPR) repeat protein
MRQQRHTWAAAALLAILLFGCGGSPEARRDRFLSRGKTFLQKREYARAVLEFKSASAVMPKDAEPYYQTGLAAIAAGDIKTAISSLRRALELNPKHAGARLKIAQMMSLGDKDLTKEAEGRLKDLLLELSDTSDKTDVLNSLAFTELRLGKADEAAQSLEQVLTRTPQALNASVMLAEARVAQKDPKGAEEILKKACEAAPKAADPRIVLAKFYEFQQRNPEAEAQFQSAMKAEPNNWAALMGLATLRNSLGQKEEAEEDFKRLAASGDRTYKPVHALFLFEQGRHEDAVKEFEKLYQASPDDRLARTRLVAAYVSVKRDADAGRVLDAALKKNSQDLDALLQRGEMSVTRKDYVKAEADLNQVLRLQPDSTSVQYTLARLNLARGAPLIYRQDLYKVLQLNPVLLTVRVELAQALITGKAAKSALDVLNEAPGSQKKATAVLITRNWALWALGDFVEMRKGIDEGLARQRSADLLIQDGLWKLNSGNPAGARVSMEEALKANPRDIRALSMLQRTYVAQKQSSTALEKVKEYAAGQPKSAPAQQFLGMMLMTSGNLAQAREAFTEAKRNDPKYVAADISLVQLDAADGKWGDAQTKLQSIVSANPGNTLAQLWLGNVEDHRGDHAAAIEQFRKVVAADPRNTQALNNLAYLLSEYGKNPGDALKYAEQARELAPDNPDFADTIGWILYRKGLYPSAVKQLEFTASHQGNAVWQYHLAMAYAKNGDVARGRAALEAALKQNPKLPEAKMAQDVLSQAK